MFAIFSTRRLLSATLPLVMFLPAVSAQTLDVLTLDAALAMAVEHNRQLETSELSVQNAEASVANAKADRFPILDFSSTAAQSLTQMAFTFPRGAFGTFENTGPVPGDDVSVKSARRPLFLTQAMVTQPLTQLRRINLGVKAKAAARDIEQERHRGAVQTVLANVRQLYYSLLNTDRAIVAANQTLQTARELDEVVRQRLTQRVVLRTDGLESERYVAQAEQNRLTLINTRASQQEQLNQLLGRDLRTPFTVAPVLTEFHEDDDLEAVTKRALERRHEVIEARLKVDQAELDRKAKSAEATPDVSIAFSYTSAFNVDVLPRNYTTLGLQVSWEPWDWGKRQREVGQKANVVHQARLALKDAEDQVVREVAASYRRLQETRSQVRVVRLSEDIARERARVRIEQIKVAAVLPVDGLAAQTELAQAGARHQEALSAYWTARAQYELAIGEDVR